MGEYDHTLEDFQKDYAEIAFEILAIPWWKFWEAMPLWRELRDLQKEHEDCCGDIEQI